MRNAAVLVAVCALSAMGCQCTRPVAPDAGVDAPAIDAPAEPPPTWIETPCDGGERSIRVPIDAPFGIGGSFDHVSIVSSSEHDVVMLVRDPQASGAPTYVASFAIERVSERVSNVATQVVRGNVAGSFASVTGESVSGSDEARFTVFQWEGVYRWTIAPGAEITPSFEQTSLLEERIEASGGDGVVIYRRPPDASLTVHEWPIGGRLGPPRIVREGAPWGSVGFARVVGTDRGRVYASDRPVSFWFDGVDAPFTVEGVLNRGIPLVTTGRRVLSLIEASQGDADGEGTSSLVRADIDGAAALFTLDGIPAGIGATDRWVAVVTSSWTSELPLPGDYILRVGAWNDTSQVLRGVSAPEIDCAPPQCNAVAADATADGTIVVASAAEDYVDVHYFCELGAD